jgi:hypothetical protein
MRDSLFTLAETGKPRMASDERFKKCVIPSPAVATAIFSLTNYADKKQSG